MAKDQEIAVNHAVHKLQLALLDGITDQKHLFAAGSLISRLDYEDVVTERTIANLCGYPLCGKSLPSEVSRRGKYRISLKEHKVYDLHEIRKFCSASCLISSRAFSKTLQKARSDFDSVKLNEILSLFDDSHVEGSLDVNENENSGLSKLIIHENQPEVKVEELSQWMGPSNAVEGYVPLDRSDNKTRNGKNDSKVIQSNQKKHEGVPLCEEFTSKVIVSDEYNVSRFPSCSTEDPLGDQLKEDLKTLEDKSSLTGSSSVPKKNLGLPTQSKQASLARESEDGKGKTVKRGLCKDRKLDKAMKNFGFGEMNFGSSAIMSDGYNVEYSVSKKPSCLMEDPLSGQLNGPQTLDGKSALIGSASGSNTKGSKTKPEKLGKKVRFAESHANSCEDGDKILTAKSCEGFKDQQDLCSSSETVTKSCLKVSGSKKLNNSVTWADQNDGHGDLCGVRNNDLKAGPSMSSSETEDVNSILRLALAEACAEALSQAAEAVSSGDSDASDAVAKAGIVLLPSTHQLDEEVSEEEVIEEEVIEEEIIEEEPTLVKWPNKPGIPDSDMFDRDQSWFDGAPEGFNLTLSSFAMMWDTLFGWVSSSSLAYIYGKDESAHEEFLSVNGKEYLRRITIGDGRSSEIKETIAGCLARALPKVATDLNLRISISVLEKGLGSLLETMSLTGAVPSFRGQEWLVIVLLFLDALSVSRIPRIASSILNKNKILEGSGIGIEEYEIMKDILLPLGRVPQFVMLSGA